MTSLLKCAFLCNVEKNCSHFYIKDNKSSNIGKLISYAGIDSDSKIFYQDNLKQSAKSIFLQFKGSDDPSPLFFDLANVSKIEEGCMFPKLNSKLKDMDYPGVIISPQGHFIICTWNGPASKGIYPSKSCYRFPENTADGWKLYQNIFTRGYRKLKNVLLPNGKYWFFTDIGYQIKTQYLDPLTMTETNGIDLPAPLKFPCVVQHQKYLTIMVGGETSGATVISDLRIYEWNNQSWKSGLSSMVNRRRNAACGIYKNVDLLVTGGSDGNALLDSCEKYNFDSNSWSSCGKLPQGNEIMHMIEDNGDLYAFGGKENPNTILKYNGGVNPSSTTWISIGTIEGIKNTTGIVKLPISNYFC